MGTLNMTRSAWLITVTLTLFALATAAPAAITVKGHWRLGESDTGAANAATGAAVTVDETGTLHLDRLNGTSTVAYTNDAAPGSDLAMGFTVNPYYAATGSVTSATNNFGYEIWIRPRSGFNADRNIFGNVSNGTALIVSGGNFAAVYQFVVTQLTTTPLPVSDYFDVWTHLAIVRDGGTTTFYLNGDPYTVISPLAVPLAATAETFISQANTSSQHDLDEARIFEFAPGAFAVTDLLYFSAIPEPATLALLAMGSLLIGRPRRPNISQTT